MKFAKIQEKQEKQKKQEKQNVTSVTSVTSVPEHRVKEILKLYEVFCDIYTNSSNYIDLEERKEHFKKIVKLKYSWFSNDEYKLIYNLIKENEYSIFIDFKKIQIEKEYKSHLIKLFSTFDKDNNHSIDINEFKFIMKKYNIFKENEENEEIENIFKKADLNNDGALSIEEFLYFLAKNEFITQKLNDIIDCKFENKRQNDKRTILFTDFPGSPLENRKNFTDTIWRPSLSNLKFKS